MTSPGEGVTVFTSPYLSAGAPMLGEARGLIDCIFRPYYDKKSYSIDDICFDRDPTNQTFDLDGIGTITLFDYYKKIKGITIEEKDQPLLVVKKTDKEKNPITIFDSLESNNFF